MDPGLKIKREVKKGRAVFSDDTTMSSSPYKFKDDSIKCSLCHKFYTNPRLLPCLHSFCKDCLSKYILNYLEKGQGQQGQNSLTGQQVGFDDRKSPKKDGPARTQFSRPPRRAPPQGSKTLPQTDPKPSDLSIVPPPQTATRGFPCPVCRKFAITAALPRTAPDKWADLFPENNLLTELVELNSLKLGTRTCNPCKRNKTSSRVTTYCKICRDALCEQCTKTHNGLRSCRSHKAWPISQLTATMEELKAGEQFCKKHDERVMDHFCFKHMTPCCSECLKDVHQHCEKVLPVTEAVAKNKEMKDIATLENALRMYNEHIQVVLKERSTQMKKLDNRKGKLMDEFLAVKSNIIAQLEKMEKDLKVILESTHRQETRKMKVDTARCKEIQSGVLNASELLNVVDHHGGDSHHVEFVERVRLECEYYEESLGILCSKIRAVDYEVTLDSSLQQVLKRLNQFGRIDVKTSSPNLPPMPKFAGSLGHKITSTGPQITSTSVKPVKPTYNLSGKHTHETGDFCGRLAEDVNDCWFTGAVFMPDGRILLADRTNRKLKMFTDNFRPITDTSLSSRPWDVTLVSEKEVAITLPAECRIQFISVGDSSLIVTRVISTDEPCFGLHYTKGKIFTVTYDGNPPNLKVLSPEGQELTYVCVDDDGFPLFAKPVYVTCNSDGSQIYVSDERLGCIVNLRECGELNYTYSAMDLGHIAGMALDNEGNIYASGNTSNCVHVLSPNGEYVRVLVTGEDVTFPRALAFHPRGKMLLVTQGDQDIVKVYSLAK